MTNIVYTFKMFFLREQFKLTQEYTKQEQEYKDNKTHLVTSIMLGN